MTREWMRGTPRELLSQRRTTNITYLMGKTSTNIRRAKYLGLFKKNLLPHKTNPNRLAFTSSISTGLPRAIILLEPREGNPPGSEQIFPLTDSSMNNKLTAKLLIASLSWSQVPETFLLFYGWIELSTPGASFPFSLLSYPRKSQSFLFFYLWLLLAFICTLV